jgi:NADH-quinone oxidoreductase subunit J
MSESSAYLLHLVFALGGAGLYLLAPKGEGAQRMVGAIVGLTAVVALLFVLGMRIMTQASGTGYFLLFAGIAIIAAARVVTHRKPVYAALYFVLVVVATAAMLVLLAAEFVAVALIIIYAGAILVTYLFVIMLAQQSTSPVYDRRSREPFASILMGFLLAAAVAGRVGELPQRNSPTTTRTQFAGSTATGVRTAELHAHGNTHQIGLLLMTKHIVALEVSGVLLLVSMVGAIALSRKKTPVDGFVAPAQPIGQIGKEAPPF